MSRPTRMRRLSEGRLPPQPRPGESVVRRRRGEGDHHGYARIAGFGDSLTTVHRGELSDDPEAQPDAVRAADRELAEQVRAQRLRNAGPVVTDLESVPRALPGDPDDD